MGGGHEAMHNVWKGCVKRKGGGGGGVNLGGMVFCGARWGGVFFFLKILFWKG